MTTYLRSEADDERMHYVLRHVHGNVSAFKPSKRSGLMTVPLGMNRIYSIPEFMHIFLIPNYKSGLNYLYMLSTVISFGIFALKH